MTGIGDDGAVVHLGRCAERYPALAGVVIGALRDLESARAERLAGRFEARSRLPGADGVWEARGCPQTAGNGVSAPSGVGVMEEAADKRLRPGAAGTSARPGHALPSDLAGALRYLTDGEFDRLQRAVAGEARRRGRPLAGDPGRAAAPASEKAATTPAKKRPLPVPPGQAKLILAA